MTTYYHITPSVNVPSIMRRGLTLPSEYVKDLTPSERKEYSRVYLFKSKTEALETAVASASANACPYSLLEVRLPPSRTAYADTMAPPEVAIFTRRPIGPRYITNLGKVWTIE